MTPQYDRISSTHVWKPITDIKVGDCIHRWGDDLVVVDKEVSGETVVLVVEDEGTLKRWKYKATAQLIAPG